MPRKITTFADKVKKEAHVDICPKCNNPIQYLLTVNAVKSDSGSWKFKQKHVGVCKCNQKEFYG
jgi:hypothetical protein